MPVLIQHLQNNFKELGFFGKNTYKYLHKRKSFWWSSGRNIKKKGKKKKLYLNVYKGTCYATSECETKGGTTSGSCAAGTV